ncbi:transmembrane protein 187 [Discoglossus pictus]
MLQDNAPWHVAAAFSLCLALVSTGILDAASTELGHSHYAEIPVPWLPSFLAMPCNSLINIGYIVLGIYWLRLDDKVIGIEDQRGHYLKNVFSWMALAYGPVQWVRIWTQMHWAAVLDQWFTLPIFAWAFIWCNSILNNWTTQHFLVVEALSLSSYFLCVLFRYGFEIALALHIFLSSASGLKLQFSCGDTSSKKYLVLALTSCLGFVSLKLLDHWLAEFLIFQRLTGHFWSKICDILQFHYAFCFLSHLDKHRTRRMKKN